MFEVENLVIRVLGTVAEKLEIKKWRYERRILEEDIYNFIGDLFPVTLIDTDTATKYHLFVKKAPKSISPPGEIVQDLFTREVYFYNTLLPIFKEASNLSIDQMIPECFYADSNVDKQILVLQDMTLYGYRRYKGNLLLDKEHLLLALKALAKFHVLSMILNERNIVPPQQEVLRPFLVDYPSYYTKCVRNSLKKYLFLFDGLWCEKIMRKLFHYISSSTKFLNDVGIKSKCLVYGHGDLWKENILYKYSDCQPVQVCFVDYQLTTMSPPAWDALFLIVNSTGSSEIPRQLKQFLSSYFNYVQENLKEIGMNSDKIYSEQDFKSDLKLIFPSCFGRIFMSYLMWLGIETADSLLGYTHPPTLDLSKTENFKNVIEDVIRDCNKCELIEDNYDY